LDKRPDLRVILQNLTHCPGRRRRTEPAIIPRDRSRIFTTGRPGP
jgi:hypothetical protein